MPPPHTIEWRVFCANVWWRSALFPNTTCRHWFKGEIQCESTPLWSKITEYCRLEKERDSSTQYRPISKSAANSHWMGHRKYCSFQFHSPMTIPLALASGPLVSLWGSNFLAVFPTDCTLWLQPTGLWTDLDWISPLTELPTSRHSKQRNANTILSDARYSSKA